MQADTFGVVVSLPGPASTIPGLTHFLSDLSALPSYHQPLFPLANVTTSTVPTYVTFLHNATPHAHVSPEADPRGLFSRAVNIVNVVSIPLIVLLGSVGNLLSFVVFTRTHLRYQSSSVYLAFLNLVDTGFLLALFLTWFSWLDLHVFHVQGMCQGVVYFTYVFSFLSVWTVVGFTVERFIVVFWPLQRQQLCTRKRAKIVLGTLSGVSLVLYSFALWTTGVLYKHIHVRGVCMPYPSYFYLLKILTHIDTVLTFIMPSIAIVSFNSSIAFKIYHFLNRDKLSVTDSDGEPPMQLNRLLSVAVPGGSGKLFAGRRHRSCGVASRSSVYSLRSSVTARSRHRTQPASNTRHFQIRTTRSLLVVSSVFLLLNLPSHAFRMHAFVMSFQDDSYRLPMHVKPWEQLCQLVYYLSFGANFLLYVVCSRSFRSAFRRVCIRFRTSARSGMNKVESMSLICRYHLARMKPGGRPADARPPSPGSGAGTSDKPQVDLKGCQPQML